MADQDFVLVKLSNDKALRKLETAIFQGATVICEGVGEVIEPAISSVVYRDIQEVKGEKYIKFNDNQMEYNELFSLYLVTDLANPHFSPELQTRTMMLNFSITKEGLEQQLLSVVCRHESARDEDEKDRLLRHNIEFQE